MSREEAASDWSDFFWECPECGWVNVREDDQCQKLGCKWERRVNDR